MGRPKSAHVESVPGQCGVHGDVELRVHVNYWSKRGKPYYRKRCPLCLRQQQQNLREGKPAGPGYVAPGRASA